MISNQKIKLIPVLELSPSDFSKVERVSPKGSTIEVPQEWLNYNQICYKDSGLDKIQPIEPLSWLFKIESISDDELKIILKKLVDSAVENFDSIKEILDDPREYAPLIPGGYLLVVDNVVISEPGCCCGLEDILEWKSSGRILTDHNDEDFVDVLKDNFQVEISTSKDVILLSIDDYDEMINDTEMIIDNFIERSGRLLNEIFEIESGKSFAKGMIYKWE